MRILGLLAGAAACAVLTVIAAGFGVYSLWAQPLVQQALTGNEVFTVAAGGPGGSSFFVPMFAVRNGSNYTAVAGGTTVNTTITPTGAVVIATGAITTWNIQMPLQPYDGQMVQVTCPGGTATTVAVTYTPGTLSGTAFTGCTAGGIAANGAGWIYSASNTTWNRIR